nr:unnamed protein product [Callosobruchus analis]
MSWVYNDGLDQVIIEALDKGEKTSPTHVEDNVPPDTVEEMVMPIISSVYSENPEDQNLSNKYEEPECADLTVSQQDNGSNMSDSDIELVSVDYTNDTLSDSSEDKQVQTVKKTKKTRRGRMLPNPCLTKLCRNQCKYISEADREVLFKEFDSLTTTAKKAYIQKWVNVSLSDYFAMGGKAVTAKATRDYYVLLNNRPTLVCAKFFTATLGISFNRVSRYVKEVINDATKCRDAGKTSITISINNESTQIDVAKMIREIERNEEIWNLDLQKHEARDVGETWDKICDAVVEDYPRKTLEQQNYIRKKLIAYWLDLKSTYFNYFTKKRQFQSSNPNTRPPFMPYSHLLTFLDSTFSPDATNDDYSSENPDGYATVYIMENHQSDEAASPESLEAEPSKHRTSPFGIDEDHLTKKPKLEEQSSPFGILSLPFTVNDQPSPEALTANDEAEEELSAAQLKSNTTETVNSSVVDSEECELNFFKSLLPIIKTLDQQKRLQFRLGVITNLQKLTGAEKSKINSQQNGIQQSEVSQAAPQNPVITSTSLSAGRLSSDNLSENFGGRSKSPNFAVVVSSESDDSDC